jgi:hypothetical protein
MAGKEYRTASPSPTAWRKRHGVPRWKWRVANDEVLARSRRDRISFDPRSGRVAYVRADEGEGVGWTFRLRLLNPEAEIQSPGKRIYKVRWG